MFTDRTKWIVSVLAIFVAAAILVYVGIGLLPATPFAINLHSQSAWISLIVGIVLAVLVFIFMRTRNNRARY